MKRRSILRWVLPWALSMAGLVSLFATVHVWPGRAAAAETDAALPAEPVVYVAADPANPANWDIIYMQTGGVTTNLSIQADLLSPVAGNPLFFGGTIDNHPVLSHDGTQLVFASDRVDGANIDLWLLDLTTSTSAITVTAVTQLTSGPEPERHPHFSEDGRFVLFDAKRKCGPLKPSQCSQPAVPECDYPGMPGPDDGNLYEGIYLFDLAIMAESPLLDPAVADPSWPDNSSEGHASFLEGGNRIIFGADRGLGDDGWEVYAADYVTPSQTLANLQQLTSAPGKPMAGGGIFSAAGDGVFFNSTATRNSQLYHIPLGPDPLSWDDWQPIASNCANDYVPEHLDEDGLLFTRQTYPDPANPDLYDLDVWAKDLVSGDETNLTNDGFDDQTLLLGDEVVCFCGGPPNTSGCYLPRIWSLCSVRQMRLIAEGRSAGLVAIPPDYAERLSDYWHYLFQWVNRYQSDPQHPELASRAQYIQNVLQVTDDSIWNPNWCRIQAVLPGFMPPQPPEIVELEIVALSLTSGQSTPVRVTVTDEYCDGCLDFGFSATGGTFVQNLYPKQRPSFGDEATVLTATWTAPIITGTHIYTLTARVTDTTGLSHVATQPVTVTRAPPTVYLPIILR